MLKKLKNLLTNNIGLKFLSVLFAMILWLVVVNTKQEKGKQPIAEQLKAAQREAQADRGQDTPKRSIPDRGDR